MDRTALHLWQGKKVSRLPIWMMRQAGRYLPEYRATRAQAGSFLDLCLTSKLATEVTLQPLRRYDFDVAILFADILLVPYALGQKLDFIEGHGPRLSPCRTLEDLTDILDFKNSPQNDQNLLSPVFETLNHVRAALDPRVTLYGFAGGPWTVSCYMVQGEGHKGFPEALCRVRENGDFLDRLLDLITETTITYLDHQIQAGADVIQLFESWANLLPDLEDFTRLVIQPTRHIVSALKIKHPQTPILGFPRGVCADFYSRYLRETGVDGVSLDPSVDLAFARDELQKLKPVQGNLDPVLLREGGFRMDHAIEQILINLDATTGRHVMGLGHGVLPDTPPDHVAQFVQRVRAWEASL